MSAIKEPNFFVVPRNAHYAKRRVANLDMYEQLFDPIVPVRGEASTSYADYPRRQGVPERIKELVPGAKFIYLVRDPIARTVSHYQHLVASEGERRPLRKVLGDLSDRHSPCICPSMYASQLDRYLLHFPQERIMVVDQAELLADRRSTLRQVFDFLEVDDRDVDMMQVEDEFLKSSERRAYPPGFARFIGFTVAPRLQWLSPRARRSLRRSVDWMLPRLDISTLDDELRARLEQLYMTEVERLRALTGKTFESWSL